MNVLPWRRAGHLCLAWLAAFITASWLAQASSSSKLSYDIDIAHQDIIDTSNHFFPLPTFTGSPPYFVIGGIFSLSFSDDALNPDGYQNVLAMQCAVADMNIIGPERGIPTQWYYQIFNDRSQPATALRAAVQLLEAGVSVTLGPTQADSALAVTSLSNAFNITKLAGIVTIDVLSRVDLYGSFFRTVPPDKYTAQVMGNIMLYFNWTLVTPIFTDDAYGLSGVAAFSKVAVDLGILSTCTRRIPAGGTTGLQDSIQCLKSSQSNVVLLWMEPFDALNVLTVFWDAGLTDLTYVATAAWGDFRDIQILAQGRFPTSYLEGTIAIIPNPGKQNIVRDCIMERRIDAFVGTGWSVHRSYSLCRKCPFLENTCLPTFVASLQIPAIPPLQIYLPVQRTLMSVASFPISTVRV